MVVKQGDLFPPVDIVVKDSAGVVVDVTGATIKFYMRKSRDAATVKVNNANGTVVTGPAGKIEYQWSGADTDTAGTYEAEFRVTPGVGNPFRVPTDGYIPVIVEEKVA